VDHQHSTSVDDAMTETEISPAGGASDAISAEGGAGGAGVPVIEMRDVSARVGGRLLWSGVDLTVRPGEFLAVLGPNGAGKSTLVKIVLGLLPPAAGQVRVLDGTPRQVRAHVGYLPQRRSFDASVRVRGLDLVRLGLDGQRWGTPFGDLLRTRASRAARARIAEVVDLVGASGYAHRPIGELSGGEQQRLLIAQALVRRPRLLVLDEPLDSLDLPNQGAIAALVGRVCRAENVSVLMVAHDVNPIMPYLDRVLYLTAGGAASGTVAEVVTTGTLSRLYRAPVEVLRASDGRLVVVGLPDAAGQHTAHHSGTPVDESPCDEATVADSNPASDAPRGTTTGSDPAAGAGSAATDRDG
jgi:zinc/manganese transport system ATP-binding protein